MRALAIASLVFAGLLAAITGISMLNQDPLGGEPYALLTIDPAKRPSFGGVPVAPPPDQAAPAEHQQTVRKDPAAAAPSSTLPPPPRDIAMAVQGGAINLPPVPDERLVEHTRYGPLPKIGSDDRRPSAAYARPSQVSARPQQGEPARIAVLINGLGLSQKVTTEAITKLPGPVTLAFSPYGRNLQSWVRQARGAGHEVMLQIPLEPFDYPDNDPGPQTLLTSLTPEENKKRLLWLMGRFTGYTGITNHMGAKFAAAQDAFLPVLEEMRARGLIYLDDGTSARSTAGSIARDLGLGFSVAQIQIDADKTPEGIEEALSKLENIALENGFAIGVGTSLPITVKRLADWAEGLEKKGIVLIPVSAAVQAQRPS